MNRIISWFQISLLRQVLTVFVVALTLFVAPVFNSYKLIASAETVVSPEGVYYKAVPDDSIHNRINEQNNNRSVFDASDATKNQAGERAKNPLKDATVNTPEGAYYKATPDDRVHNRINEHNQSGFNASDATDTTVNTVNTPEGVYYKATPDDSVHNRINEQNNNRSVFDASDATKNQGGQKSENPFKEAVDTVREKLNLDEELPRSTKEFLKETEEKVEETVEPVTGTRKGYYQIP